MTKVLQNQYYIYKIPSNKITKLKTYSFKEASKDGCVVSIGDNLVLAKIREYYGENGDHVSLYNKVQDIRKEMKKIRKLPTSTENVEAIKNFQSQLDNLLFVDDIVNIKVVTKKEYRELGRKGFDLNGKHYVRFMVGSGQMRRNTVTFINEELFDYMQVQPMLTPNCMWLSSYIDEYKKAKLGNIYTDEIKTAISEHNADSVAFDTWYQSLKTTRFLLAGRNDIDVYYWIDGLGVEWIPFIQAILAKHQQDNIYLNEVMVARALLPTTTEVNKVELQHLSDVDIQTMKVGDLDSMAHQSSNRYPNTIISEMRIVEDAVESIINKYAGKKIAIVSDHGLTYLSQLQGGLNLAGFDSDHHGRLAVCKIGKATNDKNYLILEDGNTVCALNHKSLCNKVPRDQGIHGGCTPEEVMVPIFVISNNPNNNHWSVVVLSQELTTVNPQVRLRIKGLSASDIPYVVYNNKSYPLTKLGMDEFMTAPLEANENDSELSVLVGDKVIDRCSILWKKAAQEEDLFDF